MNAIYLSWLEDPGQIDDDIHITMVNNLIKQKKVFLKGRNISTNIRLILDIIEYTETNDLPGSIVLLDIEKAFDSVNHDFY